jgi:hypothetical protein
MNGFRVLRSYHFDASNGSRVKFVTPAEGAYISQRKEVV